MHHTQYDEPKATLDHIMLSEESDTDDPFGHGQAGLDEHPDQHGMHIDHPMGDDASNHQQATNQHQPIGIGRAERVDDNQVVGDVAAGFHSPPLANPRVQTGEPMNKSEPGLTPQEPDSPTPLPYDHHDRFPMAKQPKKAQQLFELVPQDLPLALRFGLPPDMSNRLDTTFWDITASHVQTQAPHLRQRMGLDDHTRKQRAASKHSNDEAQKQLSQHGVQQHSQTSLSAYSRTPSTHTEHSTPSTMHTTTT